MSLQSIFELLKQSQQPPTSPGDGDRQVPDIFEQLGIHVAPPFSKTEASSQPGEGQKPVKQRGPGDERVSTGDDWVAKKGDYRKLFQDKNGVDYEDRCPNPHHTTHPQATDCGRFMHQIFSKVDPTFPKSGTGTLDTYLRQHSDAKHPTKNDTYYDRGAINDTSIRPGDLLLKPPPDSKHAGHTAMLGGISKDKKGRTVYTIYDASFGDNDPKTGQGPGRLPTKRQVYSLKQFQYYARPHGEK